MKFYYKLFSIYRGPFSIERVNKQVALAALKTEFQANLQCVYHEEGDKFVFDFEFKPEQWI